MEQYLKLMDQILKTGSFKDDRTSTGTLSIFGTQLRFDLDNGFPLLTTKKLHFPSIAHELIWFLSGSTNIRYLTEHNVHIWDNWSTQKGIVGKIYPYQWRWWNNDQEPPGYDQIYNVIEQIKEDPNSRRHIVTAWNPSDLKDMALPPCHMMFQFYVLDGKISTHVYMRSCDVFLGLPFNIASYALLTQMVAQVCNLTPNELIISIGDAHLYLNHMEQAKLQLTRTPKSLPTMTLNKEITNIFDFKFSDFTLSNYTPDPHIKAEVAV